MLIERTRDPDLDGHCDNLQAHLHAAPIEDVEGFHRCLVGVFDWLDTLQLRTAAALMFGGLTEPTFAAFRARLILAGKDACEAAAADPDTLIEIDTNEWKCVRLLELGPQVYEQRQGHALEAWTLDQLSKDRIDRLPEGYLEGFRERFPRFWKLFPWGLDKKGRMREYRSIIGTTDLSCITDRRYTIAIFSGLGLFAAQLLLVTGHWGGAAIVFGATLVGFAGGVYSLLGDMKRCFIASQRPRGEDLAGTVRYRVIRLTPPHLRIASWRRELADGLAIVKQEAERYGKNVDFAEVGPAMFLDCAYPESLSYAIDDVRSQIERVRDELREGEGPSFVVVVADAGNAAFACMELGAACLSNGKRKGTFAHEILHLFGACDLYESDRLDQFWWQGVRRTAESLFFDDFDDDEVSIMDDSSDSDARVDLLTARLVGWT